MNASTASRGSLHLSIWRRRSFDPKSIFYSHNIYFKTFNNKSIVASIQKVFLSQLLPRHPGTYFRPGYNKMAYYVNDILLRSAVAADQRLLRVFRFKDFSFPQEDEKRFNRNHRLFHRDGTHLTVWGYKRLRRAMKAAVIACVKP